MFLRLKPLVLGACLLSQATVSHSQDRPFQLVCFDQKGITAGLDQVVNAQQFLRNDRRLQSGSCGFAQIPTGSTARYVGIHTSPNGFHYPLYRVTYATTGQRMYAADGIFKVESWKILRDRNAGVRVISPVTCEVLDSYLQVTGGVPSYMFVPDICNLEVVE